jgi:hypothetical protein
MDKRVIAKFDFACTLAGEESPIMNDCERYGMTWGCDADCPVFCAGKCELQKENEELFKTRTNG